MSKSKTGSRKSGPFLASKDANQGKKSSESKAGSRLTVHGSQKKTSTTTVNSEPGSTRSTKDPQTMDELLAQTGGLGVRGFKRGDVIIGHVSSISGKEVLIDFGGKMEGIVGEKEWDLIKDFVAKLHVGDEISAVVVSGENVQGQMIVSIKRAGSKYRWQHASELLENGESVNVKGLEVNKGGLVVEFEGIRGFIPSSQLSAEHQAELPRMVNRTLAVKVIEVDESANRLVFSEKAVTGAADLAKKLEEVRSKVKIGEKYPGKVSAIMTYGVFVNLDNGTDGLVHISEVAWSKVSDLNSMFKVGDVVEVMVLGVSESDGKLNLSIKQLLPDPWLELSKKYSKEQEVKGKVTRVSSYGIFVELEEGVEGLIHISKVPAGTEYEVGDKVTCTVESIDASAHRISLIPVLKAKPIGYK